MEDYLTPYRTANAIMQNKSFDGYYVIVEGMKDYKVYQKFFNEDEIIIKEAFGKYKVVEVLNILTERGFKNKIGIVDSDFSQVLAPREIIDNLFVTDDHDIEIMIIKTKALETVVNLYCSKSRIKEFEKLNKKTIREILFLIGREIGFLKFANKMHDLGLLFKPKQAEGNQIRYKHFVDDKDLKYLGKDRLIEAVFNFSQSKSKNIKAKDIIREKFNEISAIDFDVTHIVNGHDLSNILLILMKNVLKSSNKMLFDFNSVEDSLILAYQFSDFQNTNLFKDLKEWSDSVGCSLFT